MGSHRQITVGVIEPRLKVARTAALHPVRVFPSVAVFGCARRGAPLTTSVCCDCGLRSSLVEEKV